MANLNVDALPIFRAVEFDWTTSMPSVWQDSNRDVSSLHAQERKQIIDELEKLKLTHSATSPLGMVMAGRSGAGKTHLLSQLRRYAVSHDISFILVDMTDVRDFWETATLGYVNSLQAKITPEGKTQSQHLIDFLLTSHPVGLSQGQLAQAEPPALKKIINTLLSALAKTDKPSALNFQDVLRALILLNCDDFSVCSLGSNWLQGLEIDADDKTTFGFTIAKVQKLSHVVEGLSWLLSLQGPTLLALDQLDSIVSQHHQASLAQNSPQLTDEQQVSLAIIEGIGGGLSALRDKTRRTLTLVSCLEGTWEILRQTAISTFKDRYQPPMVLKTVPAAEIAEQLVLARLKESYDSFAETFSPPYPTWPFAPAFFQAAVRQPPRRILQRCNDHLKLCLSKRSIDELETFDSAASVEPNPDLPHLRNIDRRLAEAKPTIDLALILDEQYEDSALAELLQTACQCLLQEHSLPDSIDGEVELSTGGKNFPLLHVRVRLTFREQGDLEKHLCLRALQRTNAKAYQTRLKAAMTDAGIDRALTFRKLAIVRTLDNPGGAATQNLIKQFADAGGLFLNPSQEELTVLAALHAIKAEKDPYFELWLRDRRPVSKLTCMQAVVSWLFSDLPATPSSSALSPSIPSPSTLPEASQSNHQKAISPPDANPAPSPVPSLEPLSPTVGATPVTPPTPDLTPGHLPLGARLIGQQTRESISIPLADLSRHVVVLAGSGSGKTVLVRRLTEEAILQGIPAIVIDCANDLARMGDSWPTAPEGWYDSDSQKASRYHQTAQVRVWTPGRESGRPLNLNPLPDFAAVANSADDLNQAIDMVRDSLQDIVAPGQSATAKTKRGILRSALDYFVQNGAGSLEDFAELLANLPPEASGGISNAQKKAQDMSDLLNAEILNNPLLRQNGTSLDPAILFGVDLASQAAQPPTRLSVINFIGLPGLDAQRQFLNQLFMTLFTWIKKNPPPAHQPLRGLLILDEAKDFVPSQGTTPCKASLNRLFAQARKYGLGLIVATQAPKSIDHNIIANCSTQFYGRANSPAAIAVINEQLSQRGGNASDIAKLQRGQFYLAAEHLTAPIKIAIPMCLSHHPASPLDEQGVLARATQ